MNNLDENTDAPLDVLANPTEPIVAQSLGTVYDDFVRRLTIAGYSLLAGKADRVEIALTPVNYRDYLAANPAKDLYIVGGVDTAIGLRRSGDKDIRMKNYFVIDVDVRNLWKAQKQEITDEEIKELGHWLVGALSDHPHLSKWSYIVYSGNGIHIWYIGEPVAVKSIENWRHGMQHIHREFEKHTKLAPDESCVSVGWLFRLPGSFNNKKGRHTLVEILHFQ
jgi:hypothetical protein